MHKILVMFVPVMFLFGCGAYEPYVPGDIIHHNDGTAATVLWCNHYVCEIRVSATEDSMIWYVQEIQEEPKER